MSSLYSLLHGLLLEPQVLDDPHIQQVLLEEVSNNVHHFCREFLTGLLSTLNHLRDCKKGMPAYLSQVCFYQGGEGVDLQENFQKILAFVLRMGDISTALNASGIVFQGKGHLRQIIVKTTYCGLTSEVCKSICRRLQKYQAPKSFDSTETVDFEHNDGETNANEPNVKSADISNKQEVPSRSSSNSATQCAVPCLQCAALRGRKKVLLQHVRRLKENVAAYKRKIPTAKENKNESATQPSSDHSALVARLIHNGTYLDSINGVKQLSITSGLIITDLSVHCGVSMEKLPLVLLLVLHLFFGDAVDGETCRSLVKSSSTYEIAMRRAADSVKQEVSCSFASTADVAGAAAATSNCTLTQNVLSAHMIIDDSNKGIDLSVLPYTARLMDGTVAARALLTVHSITKQSTAWERLYNHIASQIGEAGIVRFLGGTTDAFGAAVKTMKSLMGKIDEIAPQFRTQLLHKSTVNDGLVLDFSVPIRSMRIVSCRMHNLERCHAPLLGILMQETGIDNEMYTGQLLYLSHYCIAVGGSASNLKHQLPKIARKLVGKVAPQRWISQERTAKEQIDLENVPASKELIEFVAQAYGGTNSPAWLAMAPYFVCFSSDQLSLYSLTLLLLSNHTTKEISALCWRVLGFLCSPAHRIALYLTSQLYPKHQQVAAFLDGKSRTHTATACSTRAIELVSFERKFLHYTHGLHKDWQSVFPEGLAFIKSESERAKSLGIVSDANVYYEKFDSIMRKGCTSMYQCAVKYFYEPNLSPGMSILHLTCAATAPHYADVILNCVSITGTLAEQAFSSARNILRNNNAESTHIDSLQHFQVVRRVVLDYNNAGMQAKESTVKAKSKNRTLQATLAKVNYCRTLLSYGKQLSHKYTVSLKSVQSIIGLGKRVTSIANNYDDVLETMENNKKRQRVQRGENIGDFVADIDGARRQELKKLPKKSLTPEERAHYEGGRVSAASVESVGRNEPV
eukprot:gene17594-20041_t